MKNGLEKIVELGKHMGRTIKNNATIGILLAGASVAGFNSRCLGNEEIFGKLAVQNYVYDADFRKQSFYIVHCLGATEYYEGDGGFDIDYSNILFPPSGEKTKIISRIPGWELINDARSNNSLTQADLELAIHTQWGGPLTFSNMKNELRCSFPLAAEPYLATFGSKPITYWERDTEDPNLFYLVANVRKEIAQHGGIIPLPDLNGTYNSQEPYLHAQIRFNDHCVHLNDDDIVDLKDYSIFANAFGRTGITNINRADPNDLGAWADYDLDGDVDVNDLSIFTDYYLTSKKYHLEDGWIIE